MVHHDHGMSFVVLKLVISDDGLSMERLLSFVWNFVITLLNTFTKSSQVSIEKKVSPIPVQPDIYPTQLYV